MLKKISARVNKIILLCIAVILVVIALPIFTPAQGSYQLEFRITQLESQISDLRGQINRLESQASGIRSQPPTTPGGTRTNPRMRSGDPMFDNLATMVIEIKQDVISMQQRLSQLESSTK
ncbi:MAG TPA: hypothetical protein VK211_02370 [Kamptonema sp.]|nr:hypothetical protein [Kamptonema sp.]